jgi:hypothetical protein
VFSSNGAHHVAVLRRPCRSAASADADRPAEESAHAHARRGHRSCRRSRDGCSTLPQASYCRTGTVRRQKDASWVSIGHSPCADDAQSAGRVRSVSAARRRRSGERPQARTGTSAHAPPRGRLLAPSTMPGHKTGRSPATRPPSKASAILRGKDQAFASSAHAHRRCERERWLNRRRPGRSLQIDRRTSRSVATRRQAQFQAKRCSNMFPRARTPEHLRRQQACQKGPSIIGPRDAEHMTLCGDV